jgi:chemotaxis protein MotA
MSVGFTGPWLLMGAHRFLELHSVSTTPRVAGSKQEYGVVDLATILGMIAGAGVIAVAILLGGSFSQFVDGPSVLIVIGGGMAATLIRFPLAGVLNAFQVGGKVAFTHVKVEPRELIEKIAEMGDIVRRSGPLGLESLEIAEPNLQKGSQMIADGYDGNFIRDSMELAASWTTTWPRSAST